MLHSLRTLDDLARAIGAEPLSRSSLISSAFGAGWTDGVATVWVGARGDGDRVIGSGPPDRLVGILDEIATELPAEAHFSLPAGSAARLADRHTVLRSNDWELRWLTVPPPRHDLEARVIILPPDDPDIGTLIENAYPAAEARPGDPAVRSWAAVRDESGRLLAVAADTSGAGTGRISAVATAPAARGHGLGAAVTTALSRRLLAEFDLVLLGLYLHNDAARRLYDRTGYHGRMIVTSGQWTASPEGPT